MATALILIIISLAALTIGCINLFNYNSLVKNGIPTEGIIFNNEYDSFFGTIQLSYPNVRFITTNKEWITETSKMGLIPGYYKNGQKVIVIYKHNDHTQFVVKSKFSKIIPIILIFMGIIFLSIGFLYLLNI